MVAEGTANEWSKMGTRNLIKYANSFYLNSHILPRGRGTGGVCAHTCV